MGLTTVDVGNGDSLPQNDESVANINDHAKYGKSIVAQVAYNSPKRLLPGRTET